MNMRKAVKGSNTLTMNEATLVEALQEYFDKRFKESIVKVDGVRHLQTGSTNAFEVRMSERKIDDK